MDNKKKSRERIKKEIDDFLKNGGEIKRVPPGASAIPLKKVRVKSSGKKNERIKNGWDSRTVFRPNRRIQ